MRSRAFVLVVVFAVLVACSGGGGGGASSPDDYAAELFPSTRLLEAATLDALTGIDTDGVVHFAGTPPQLADARRGTVLLAGVSAKTPKGMLRLVVDAKQGDTGLALTTMPAPVQVAFKKLHVKLAHRSANLASWQPAAAAPLTLRPKDSGQGGVTKTIDFFPFDGDGDPSTVDDQVRVTGELGATYGYVLGMDVDWGDVLDIPEKVVDCLVSLFGGGGCSVKDLLPEVKVGFEVEANAVAKLAVAGAAFNGFAKEVDLGQVPVDPSLIVVGPLVFVVEMTVSGKVEGDASSRFSAGAGIELDAGAGIAFSTKSGAIETPPHFTKTVTPPSADASLTARAKASVGPRLALRLYDAAGAYAQVSGYTELDADRSKSPCFTLHGGADVTIGFQIGIGLPKVGFVELGSWDKTYPLFDEALAFGGCASPAGESSLAPGAGPDADHLNNPTFTPWSKSLDTALSTYPNETASFQSTRVVRTIDGHYVFAGSRVTGLTKVKGNGELVWSRRFVDPTGDVGQPLRLRLVRVAPTKDAALFVSTFPMGLLKVGQSGGLAWARRLDLARGREGGPHGNGDESESLAAMIDDGAGGAFAVGSYVAPGESVTRMLLLRFAPDGVVTLARSYAIPNDAVYANELTRFGDDLVVAGTLWNGTAGKRAFVARLAPDGGVTWAKRFVCADDTNLGMQSSSVLATHGGNLVVAGRIDPLDRSFVMALGGDGARQWFTEPWSGSKLSYFVLTGLQELPTTGFVAAGSYTNNYDPTELAVGGLDATGHLQWLRGYQVTNTDPGFQATADFGSVRLADDGGAIIGGYTSSPTSGRGSLWFLEVPAKDGTITYASGVATTRVLPFANTTCTNLAEAPVAFALADAPATTSPLTVTAEDAGGTPRSHVP